MFISVTQTCRSYGASSFFIRASYKHSAALRPDQKHALRPDQELALRPDQELALRPDQKHALRPDQELALRPDQELEVGSNYTLWFLDCEVRKALVFPLC